MKSLKIVLNVLLAAIILALAYVLYTTIREPIKFDSTFKLRDEAVKNKMKDIRTAEKQFIQVYGYYTANWDSLVSCVQNDKIKTIKTIGNPDDTSVVVKYDTIYEPIIDQVTWFTPDLKIQDLSTIPYSNGKKFGLQAAVIELQGVNIPVYEVTANLSDFLSDLQEKYYVDRKDLSLGSLNQADDSGNWE